MTYLQSNLFMSKPGYQNDVMAAVRDMKTEWNEKAIIAMMFYGGSPVGPSNVITISTRFDSLDEVEKTHDDFFENIKLQNAFRRASAASTRSMNNLSEVIVGAEGFSLDNPPKYIHRWILTAKRGHKSDVIEIAKKMRSNVPGPTLPGITVNRAGNQDNVYIRMGLKSLKDMGDFSSNQERQSENLKAMSEITTQINSYMFRVVQ